MDESQAFLALADRMLWVAALASAPVLISTLVVGVVVGIIQAATSVNEPLEFEVVRVALRNRLDEPARGALPSGLMWITSSARASQPSGSAPAVFQPGVITNEARVIS